MKRSGRSAPRSLRLRGALAILSIAASLLVMVPAASAETTEAQSARATVRQNILYCYDDHIALTLDLYQPTHVRTRPMPVVLWIHGGTWEGGSKSSAASSPDVAELRARGYLVAAVEYLFAPRHKFPAQIQDLTCAVRHLRFNHTRYGLDPNRIGAMGVSAGGHLAAMLGVQDGSSYFVSGGYTGMSSSVGAVADLYGVNDLMLKDLASYDERVLPEIFGTGDAAWRKASPVTYVRRNLPPFLLMHGDQDSDVPPIQSKEFYSKLRHVHSWARLVIVHNGEHNFTPDGGPIQPTRAAITQMIADFFDQNL